MIVEELSSELGRVEFLGVWQDMAGVDHSVQVGARPQSSQMPNGVDGASGRRQCKQRSPRTVLQAGCASSPSACWRTVSDEPAPRAGERDPA